MVDFKEIERIANAAEDRLRIDKLSKNQIPEWFTKYLPALYSKISS